MKYVRKWVKIINEKEKNSFLDYLSTGNRSGRVVLAGVVRYKYSRDRFKDR